MLKSGISEDSKTLGRSVGKVTNLERPEEALVGEDSPIRDCLCGPYFKPTTATISLLPLMLCDLRTPLCDNTFSTSLINHEKCIQP
jgi:hypothetical protein